LVEGVAEALLLRQVAESCIFDPRRFDPTLADQANQWQEAFSAIPLVSIDSVDFEPYLRLLLGNSVSLVERIVVLTDLDGGPGAARRDRYVELFFSEVEADALSIYVGTSTLEADILAFKANEELLKGCYLELHPNSSAKWNSIVSSAPEEYSGRAQYFYDYMNKDRESERLNFGKGEFAQILAERLTDPEVARTFQIPSYIQTGLMRTVR
jgi:hypothetical protein